MDIENDIFKRCKIVEEKLIDYGFLKEKEEYLFKRNILNDTFQVEVIIKECSVQGKIWDLKLDEEYTNYRISSFNGAFVSEVREEFINILKDIKESCTISNYFLYDQTNRITQKIKALYNDDPEFAWENAPGFGIFRNPENKKWYALIMNIQRELIIKDNKKGEIEIINLKLNKERVQKLLQEEGFYEAYHMNKTNWITIILDDTLKDEQIMSLIKESHAFTENKTNEWLIPANPKYYDVIEAFQKEKEIIWKQPPNIKINDIIYLYLAHPYSAIIYKCQVIEKDLPYSFNSDNLKIKQVMKIKLLEAYDHNLYTLDKLKKYGVTSVRGPRYMPKALTAAIKRKKG